VGHLGILAVIASVSLSIHISQGRLSKRHYFDLVHTLVEVVTSFTDLYRPTILSRLDRANLSNVGGMFPSDGALQW